MENQIDINRVVQKYQTIISDLQLQNILLNLRAEDLQNQLANHISSPNLISPRSDEPTVKSPRAKT